MVPCIQVPKVVCVFLGWLHIHCMLIRFLKSQACAPVHKLKGCLSGKFIFTSSFFMSVLLTLNRLHKFFLDAQDLCVYHKIPIIRHPVLWHPDNLASKWKRSLFLFKKSTEAAAEAAEPHTSLQVPLLKDLGLNFSSWLWDICMLYFKQLCRLTWRLKSSL